MWWSKVKSCSVLPAAGECRSILFDGVSYRSRILRPARRCLLNAGQCYSSLFAAAQCCQLLCNDFRFSSLFFVTVQIWLVLYNIFQRCWAFLSAVGSTKKTETKKQTDPATAWHFLNLTQPTKSNQCPMGVSILRKPTWKDTHGKSFYLKKDTRVKSFVFFSDKFFCLDFARKYYIKAQWPAN